MNHFSIPITRDELERARVKILDQQHVTLTGDQGEIEAHGVKLDFAFNGTDTLSFVVEHKPTLLLEGKLESIVREWFRDV